MPALFHIRLLLLAAACVLAALGRAEAQLNSQEQQIAALMANAAGQKRLSVEVDPILSRVARARAADMAARDYFDHVNPDGHGANYLVRQAGYTLPANYDQSPSGNNIESIAAGYSTASATWNDWMSSPEHKTHLLGLNSFFASQTSIGVGYFYDAGSYYKHYWVVLSAPPPGPALAISSPAANAALTVAQATIAGTSGGAPAAARIVFRLENANGIGAFRDAAGTATWTGSVTDLVPGPNTVRVRSLDAAGATLKELTRTFRYVVLRPLVVAVEGTGAVTSGFLGTSQRELGATYSITAAAGAGWLFDHWSGSATATAAKITFVMQDGFALTAHFRVNPFYALKGGYNGLVLAASPEHATSGFLKLSLGATGSFTGRLALGGKAYSIAGKFDGNGDTTITVKRGLLAPLSLALHLDLSGETQLVTGTVTDGVFAASLSADHAPPTTTKHFAAGRYTISLPANPADTGPQYPRGSGFGFLNVAATGAATMTGTLADGRAFTATSVVSRDGDLPLYVPLLGGTGSLAGRASVAPESGAVGGSIRWVKPERPKDRYLPALFATQITLAGARYLAPLRGVTALDVPAQPDNSMLRLSGGDLDSSVQQLATLLPTNLVLIATPQLPRLTFIVTASTGRVTGTFTHPQTHATSRISGVILQDRNTAAGFFLGQSASGAATFAPMP